MQHEKKMAEEDLATAGVTIGEMYVEKLWTDLEGCLWGSAGTELETRRVAIELTRQADRLSGLYPELSKDVHEFKMVVGHRMFGLTGAGFSDHSLNGPPTLPLTAPLRPPPPRSRLSIYKGYKSPEDIGRDPVRVGKRSTLLKAVLTGKSSQRDTLDEWMLTGETGVSSLSIVYVLTGRMSDLRASWSHPVDLHDFRRCELLLSAVPELRQEMWRMSQVNRQWHMLVGEWSTIIRGLDHEAPDWRTNPGRITAEVPRDDRRTNPRNILERCVR